MIACEGLVADEQAHHAFADLVRKYDGRLRSVAFKVLGGDRSRLDDVMQDAYLRAFRAYASFREEADAGTWLHRVVYNACIDELRRARRRSAIDGSPRSEVDRPSNYPGPERVVLAQDAVLRALAMLPPDQRATVVLVDGEGFDSLTVAGVLGVAPGTVASRLSRGRAAMRKALEEENR